MNKEMKTKDLLPDCDRRPTIVSRNHVGARLRQALLAVVCLGLFHAWATNAATNIVLSTDNLQQKIDEAAAGDVLVLQGGTYAGSISITKALALVRSGTNEVVLADLVTIQTTAAVSLVQLRLVGTLGVRGASPLSVLSSRFSGGIVSDSGTISLKRCLVDSQIILTNTHLEAYRLTNTSHLVLRSPVGLPTRLVLTQCRIDGYVSGYSVNAWLGYNDFSAASFYNGSDVVLVGNLISTDDGDPARGAGYSSSLSASGSRLRAYNNRIVLNGNSGSTCGEIYGVYLDSCSTELINNTLAVRSWTRGNCYSVAYGVVIYNAVGTTRIEGAIVQTSARDASHGITISANSAAIVTHSCVLGSHTLVSGAPTINCIYVDPALNPDLTPSFNSPCLNTGPPDSFYKDRDGTRNDMGFTGGPLYQADGMTTDKPLLFWLMPAQRQVWKNAQPTLDVEAAATAVH
jgi:hypothetical protein